MWIDIHQPLPTIPWVFAPLRHNPDPPRLRWSSGNHIFPVQTERERRQGKFLQPSLIPLLRRLGNSLYLLRFATFAIYPLCIHCVYSTRQGVNFFSCSFPCFSFLPSSLSASLLRSFNHKLTCCQKVSRISKDLAMPACRPPRAKAIQHSQTLLSTLLKWNAGQNDVDSFFLIINFKQTVIT